MAPLYATMKKITISLTPNALSGCTLALQGLEKFTLSISSWDDYIKKAKWKISSIASVKDISSIPLNLKILDPELML